MRIHDFDPGFGPPVGPNGARTFWTVAIDDKDVAVQFAAGKAEMRVANLPIRDYHTIANALGKNTFETAFDPAVVSFDVVWSGPITRRVHVLEGTLGNNYAGEYVENEVTVTWSGTNLKEGFSFTSNPGTFATSFLHDGFAELGHEGNGSFFPSDPPGSSEPLGMSVGITQADTGQTSLLAVPPQAIGGSTIISGLQSSSVPAGLTSNLSGSDQQATDATGLSTASPSIPVDVADQLFSEGWANDLALA